MIIGITCSCSSLLPGMGKFDLQRSWLVGCGFFPTQLFIYNERAVPVVLWILFVHFQCVVAG